MAKDPASVLWFRLTLYELYTRISFASGMYSSKLQMSVVPGEQAVQEGKWKGGVRGRVSLRRCTLALSRCTTEVTYTGKT